MLNVKKVNGTFGQSVRILTGRLTFLGSSLKGFPASQSKNITHNLRLPVISEACCLCIKAASFLHTKVFIKLQLMKNWALARSPLPPQLSWSLAKEHKSVCKEGREPLGSISCLLTLTQNSQEAVGCTGSCRNYVGAKPVCFGSRPELTTLIGLSCFSLFGFYFFPIEKKACDLEAQTQN